MYSYDFLGKDVELPGSRQIILILLKYSLPSEIGSLDFPGGTVVKNPPANAGDTGFSPGPGRSHMPRNN